jgi:fructokinase
VSGPGLAADHRAARRCVSRRSTRAAIVALAHAGDAAARATMARFYERLAGALATVINVLDPDVVVLGGGPLEHRADLRRGRRAPAGARVLRRVATPVVRNRHGDSSGVRGAAWLWPP